MELTANIATFSKRREILQKMLNSIRGQFDRIRVYYNDYEPEPVEWVEQYTGDDLTDRGKFLWLDRIAINKETGVAYEDEFYFSLDDDILYPHNYADKTLEALERFPNSIVCYHGRKLKGKGLNYYFGHKQFNFLGNLDSDILIDVPGTGVSAFRTDKLLPDVLQYPHQKMADVLLGLEAAKQGASVVCLKHSMWWFKALYGGETIYQIENRECGVQSAIADEIYSLRY